MTSTLDVNARPVDRGQLDPLQFTDTPEENLREIHALSPALFRHTIRRFNGCQRHGNSVAFIGFRPRLAAIYLFLFSLILTLAYNTIQYNTIDKSISWALIFCISHYNKLQTFNKF